MTNEMAIRRIERLKESFLDSPTGMALNMAIEALERAEQTKPSTFEPCCSCASKGDHDGECRCCISALLENGRYGTPSHYKPKADSRGSEGDVKIDEKEINHIATMLINELAIWEIHGPTDSENYERIMTLGYIKGITEFAELLKQTLKP